MAGFLIGGPRSTDIGVGSLCSHKDVIQITLLPRAQTKKSEIGRLSGLMPTPPSPWHSEHVSGRRKTG